MYNYKLTVEYDGTKYNGWQKQHSTQNTLQGKFQSVLEKLCEEAIEVHASGRTDAGVHAKGQVLHFKTHRGLQPVDIAEYCNTYLPQDVRVLCAEQAEERFHSRLNAAQKCYSYTLWAGKPSVFQRKYVHAVDSMPDITAMRACAQLFLGTHDFLAFSSLKKSKKSTLRTIQDIQIEQNGNQIRMEFTGNGFLYHMVRILAGTILDAGQGKITLVHVQKALQSGIRSEAGTMLPPQGLCLEWVSYKNQQNL